MDTAVALTVQPSPSCSGTATTSRSGPSSGRSAARTVSLPSPWPLANGIGFTPPSRSALREGDVRRAGGAGVLRARPDQPIVAVLLEDVGGPAGHPAHGEDGRELVGGDAHRRVASPREEVDVGIDVL